MNDSVKSPCIDICKLDTTGTFCSGCLRTRTEIGVWSKATDSEKRQILLRVKTRQTLPEYSPAKQQA